MICTLLRARINRGHAMTINSLKSLQQAALFHEYFSIYDVRDLVAQQLGVEKEIITCEAHFANDLKADLFDRVELMLKIENQFSGVEITDDDIEQIQVVGDLVRRLNAKRVKE